jgi:glycerol dehydrogenase
MLNKIQFPGKYIQCPKAIDELPALISAYGKKGLVLASPSACKILKSKKSALKIERFNGECSEKEVARVAAIIKKSGADVLVGMGGGKTIDTAKIAADKARIPVIVVPTIASTDAPCSGCAILYSDKGVFQGVYYQRANPEVVLVDTEIIANAPVRFLVSGMGDALSTWFEARSCAATQSENCCGGLGTMTGLSLARLCYDTLLRYGAQAKVAAEHHLATPAFEHIVEANILLSGVGFESGGLASAHAIHNGLTALAETHAYYHGEKVAIGTLAGLALTDASPEETATVYAFCESVGLPTTLADIGLKSDDRAHLMTAAEKACTPEEAIHHEAGKITPEKVLNALLAADAIGADRKSRKVSA